MEKKKLITVILVPTILLLIVVLFPLISWYYLRSGLEWRKEAQAVMKGTKPFPSMTFAYDTGLKFDMSNLENHVTIVSFLPCSGGEAYRTVLDEIYAQFKDTGKANFIMLDSCSQSPEVPDQTGRNKWFVLPCVDSRIPCDQLVSDWPSGTAFALVDRDGIIRSYYPIQTQDEKRILVEHMALLLPREREEKVELKRGDKK